MADAADAHAVVAAAYLFGGIPAEPVLELAAVAAVRRLARDEAVFEPGDVADELFVVISGQVKDSVLNVDGDEIVHFVHGPGMTFGEPAFFAVDHHRVVRVVATEPTTIAGLHRRHLVPFMNAYPLVKDHVLERLASNTRLQSNLISAMLTRPLAHRLALRLLELVDSNQPGGEPYARTPRISQSTLAGMVGVTRENVNRALANLIADGTIRREGTSYVLVNEAALRAMVAEDWLPVAIRDVGPKL